VLACPQCGAPLAAEGEDVVYYCTACASGFRLATEADVPRTGATERAGAALVAPGEGLVRVEVSFLAAPGAVIARHLPFWLLPATVTIQSREAAGGTVAGLLHFFTGGAEAGSAGGPAAGAFAIPAFAAPLATVTELALRYTQALPALGDRLLGEKLTGGRLTSADAEKLAHFTLIAAEAGKPDLLRDLMYTIDFGAPSLLGVPFVARGDRLADAAFGIVV
jgi:hypothetical protein